MDILIWVIMSFITVVWILGGATLFIHRLFDDSIFKRIFYLICASGLIYLTWATTPFTINLKQTDETVRTIESTR